MLNNLKYPFSLPGFLKAVTVTLGLLCSAIAGHAYDVSLYNNFYKIISEIMKAANLGESITIGEPVGKEGFFLSIVIIFTLMSLAFYIVHLMVEELGNNPRNKFADVGFHALGALLIFIGACLVISSAVNIAKEEKTIGEKILREFSDRSLPHAFDYRTLKFQYKSEKIASGVLGIINSLVYGVTAWVVFIGKTEPQPTVV